MRSEIPPPMGPATIPIKDRPAPTHEVYEKENDAAADEVRVQKQLAQNRLAIEVAQISQGSDFPAAMRQLDDARKHLKAPKPPAINIKSDSPHFDSDADGFNTWVERRLRGEDLSDLPPAMGDEKK